MNASAALFYSTSLLIPVSSRLIIIISVLPNRVSSCAFAAFEKNEKIYLFFPLFLDSLTFSFSFFNSCIKRKRFNMLQMLYVNLIIQPTNLLFPERTSVPNFSSYLYSHLLPSPLTKS